jgi:5-methylcytosine-specific restriction endonuclease McrA
LCISSVVELARVITPENSADVLPRFFYLSKQEAKAVAVEICPAAVVPRREVVTKVVTEVVTELPHAPTFHLDETPPHAPSAPAPAEERASFVPLTPNLQRLHMTVSKQFLDKLDAARKGQGHAQPRASAEKVIEAALDLLLAQQAKRRGVVKRPQKNPRPAKNASHIPAAVRRKVWSRDDGKCTWPLDSGGICGSTLRLEIDHVVPRGRGGPSTVDNSRLTCTFHNQLAARQVYGDEWMDRFTDGTAMTAPLTSA